MFSLGDATNLGVAAAHQAADFIIENVVADRLHPTPEEAEAVTAATLAAAATLEMNLRINLPADKQVQNNVRAAIEALSSKMYGAVMALRPQENNPKKD